MYITVYVIVPFTLYSNVDLIICAGIDQKMGRVYT